jgi:hypothetical protein
LVDIQVEFPSWNALNFSNLKLEFRVRFDIITIRLSFNFMIQCSLFMNHDFRF